MAINDEYSHYGIDNILAKLVKKANPLGFADIDDDYLYFNVTDIEPSGREDRNTKAVLSIPDDHDFLKEHYTGTATIYYKRLDLEAYFLTYSEIVRKDNGDFILPIMENEDSYTDYDGITNAPTVLSYFVENKFSIWLGIEAFEYEKLDENNRWAMKASSDNIMFVGTVNVELADTSLDPNFMKRFANEKYPVSVIDGYSVEDLEFELANSDYPHLYLMPEVFYHKLAVAAGKVPNLKNESHTVMELEDANGLHGKNTKVVLSYKNAYALKGQLTVYYNRMDLSDLIPESERTFNIIEETWKDDYADLSENDLWWREDVYLFSITSKLNEKYNNNVYFSLYWFRVEFEEFAEPGYATLKAVPPILDYDWDTDYGEGIYNYDNIILKGSIQIYIGNKPPEE